MKNKNLIIGGIIAMAIIGLYLYFAVKKAKITPAVQTNDANPDQATALNPTETPGSGGKIVANSPAGKTASVFKLPSWLDWLTGSGSSPSPSQPQYSTVNNNNVFPLKQGSTGEEVKNLQTWLNNHVILPYSLLNVDGKLGQLTLSALKRTLGVSEVSEAWYRVNILNTPI